MANPFDAGMDFGAREVGDSQMLPRGNHLAGYGIAALAVLLAALTRFGLDPWLDGRAHYLPFVVAVLIAGLFGGPLPAAAATIISVAVVPQSSNC